MKKSFKIFYIMVSSDHVNHVTLNAMICKIRTKNFNPSKEIENITCNFRNCPKFPIFSLTISDTQFFPWVCDLTFIGVKTLIFWVTHLTFTVKILKFLSWNFLIKCCYNLNPYFAGVSLNWRLLNQEQLSM